MVKSLGLEGLSVTDMTNLSIVHPWPTDSTLFSIITIKVYGPTVSWAVLAGKVRTAPVTVGV